MARRYEYYFQVVKTMRSFVQYYFQHEKIIFISSSYRVIFLLLHGQKSEQVNREHINPEGNTRVFHALHIFSYLHWWRYGNYECFSLR